MMRSFLSFSSPLRSPLIGAVFGSTYTVPLIAASPELPSQQRYRKARLWFSSDASDLIGVGRSENAYDHNLVKRGTVQHETFEGEKARAFIDGDAVRVQVNCREDAPGLDDPVDYGLAVSLEVSEEVPVAVYQQVRQELRPTVPITP